MSSYAKTDRLYIFQFQVTDIPPFSLARKIGARAILESAHARSYYGAGDRRKSKGAFAHLKAP